MKIQPKTILFATSLNSSLSTYHQVYKIHKHKSAKNISMMNVSSVWLNLASHLVYSVSTRNLPLMITFGNSTMSVGSFVASVYYYKYLYEE